jgi:hypothetical protein
MILQTISNIYKSRLNSTYNESLCLDTQLQQLLRHGLPCFINTATLSHSFLHILLVFLSLCFFLSFGSTGVWTQGFVLARWSLYYLSHTPSPFCFIYFSGRVSCIGCFVLDFFFFLGFINSTGGSCENSMNAHCILSKFTPSIIFP